MNTLHKACETGNIEKVRELLENGADVNIKDDFGYTPLHLSSRKGNIDTVSLLLKNGAEINTKSKVGYTPLHSASRKGNIDTISLLLENGADVNIKDNTDNTPLHLAFTKGNIDTVSLLLKNGADVNTKNKVGYTPLHLAFTKGNIDTISLLLENGADVNTQDHYGNTLLHLACVGADTDIVTLLLQNGANVHITNKLGFAPLHLACKYLKDRAIKIVTLLLESGADINMEDDGCYPPSPSPLFVAISRNQDLAIHLVEHGAELTENMLNSIEDITFKKEIKDSAEKFKSLYDSFKLETLNSFDAIESTINIRWAVYQKYFKTQNVDFPTLSNFKMFITKDLKTNISKNADFCKFLSLPSEIFHAESKYFSTQDSLFNKQYDSLTHVFSETTERSDWTDTPLLQKILSISDLMRYIVGFAPESFTQAASIKLFSLDSHAQTTVDSTESYGEEESKSDMVLTGTDNASTSEL